MVRLAGIEPTTPWFVAKYSIQLSYSREALYSTHKSASKWTQHFFITIKPYFQVCKAPRARAVQSTQNQGVQPFNPMKRKATCSNLRALIATKMQKSL